MFVCACQLYGRGANFEKKKFLNLDVETGTTRSGLQGGTPAKTRK